MCSWAFKKFSFGVRWATECCMCGNCIFPSEKELLVQGRYSGCTVSELVNSIFSPSLKIASQLSLPWAFLWLFMAYSLSCAACLFPAFLTIGFRASSDTLTHTQAHSCTLRHSHWDTGTVTCTLTRHQIQTTLTITHTHLCGIVSVSDSAWVCLSSHECVWSDCRDEGLMAAVNGQRYDLTASL